MSDSKVKPGISSAGNTAIPCLQAIVAKGFRVAHYFLGDKPGDYDSPQWNAEKEGKRFHATTLQELLGLIAMWEVRGDDWMAKSGENDLYDQLLDTAPVYDPDGNAIGT